jgi:hypothetical protein
MSRNGTTPVISSIGRDRGLFHRSGAIVDYFIDRARSWDIALIGRDHGLFHRSPTIMGYCIDQARRRVPAQEA